MISSYITGGTKYGKGVTDYGRGYSPLALFCIPTHFVGDTLSGATPFSLCSTLSIGKYHLTVCICVVCVNTGVVLQLPSFTTVS